MIDLIIVAYLLSAPDQCKPHIMRVPGTMQACARSSLQFIAQWTEDHPGWQIKRIECREFEREA